MKRMLRVFSMLSLAVLSVALFAACGSKIDNVKFINAKYGVAIESRIYPSNINAIELEQIYKKWNIGVGKDMTISGVSFDIVLAENQSRPSNMAISVNVIRSGQTECLVDRVKVDFALGNRCHEVFAQSVFISSEADVLQIVFYSGNEENSSIQFRIDNFSLNQI